MKKLLTGINAIKSLRALGYIILFGLLVKLVVFSSMRYLAEREQADRAISIDSVIVKQHAVSIKIYNELVATEQNNPLKEQDDFDKVLDILIDSKLLAMKVTLLTGKNLESYRDLKYLRYQTNRMDICDRVNDIYQPILPVRFISDVDEAYAKIKNKTSPFCLDSEVSGELGYVYLRIDAQSPVNSLDIF